MENLRTGIVASTVANYSPASRKHDHSPRDFMLRIAEPQSVGDKIRAFFGARKKGAR